jgi:hypothetical protein
MPFDRMPLDRMPFDRKVIWPNRRLTEHRSTEKSFDQKFIWPKKSVYDNFNELTFSKKCHLAEKSV